MKPRLRQAGAALLAAMLTVTLVATFAAAALWQQWRSVEIEAAERARIQATWILSGALDWARLILKEDGRSATDHLGEPWAVPLQEARLSTFLAADSSNTENEGDRTFLSGQIIDLQGLLNVNTLVQAGSVQTIPRENFRRLFELLRLPESQLATLAENLRFASDISADNRNASRAPLAPQRVEQLVWLGLPAETVATLQPYVTVLPDAATRINLNTASAEVIYAAGRNISLGDAKRLVAARDGQPFKTASDAVKLLPPDARFEGADVSSQFFELRGRLRMDDIVIEERSIVKRSGNTVQTLVRERDVLDTVPVLR